MGLLEAKCSKEFEALSTVLAYSHIHSIKNPNHQLTDSAPVKVLKFTNAIVCLSTSKRITNSLKPIYRANYVSF
jgi:hypothetical protein